jgi:ubiquinone/menaquinone biosynthesis C-methylase UbiE
MPDNPHTSQKSKSYLRTWKNPESIRRYATSRYRGLDQRLISDREKSIVNRMLKKIHLGNKTILDVPTGYGRFTGLFLENDLHIRSADLNLNALLYQRDQYQNSTDAIVADIFALPFPDRRFELVFTFRLLQHFKNSAERIKALQEIARVSNRYTIVSIYIKTTLHFAAKRISRKPQRIYMLSLDEWKQELATVGLRVITFQKVLPLLHAHAVFLLEKSY